MEKRVSSNPQAASDRWRERQATRPRRKM